MTDSENKTTAEENVAQATEQAENVADLHQEGDAAEKTVEDWAAEVAELQGQLQDERLRSAANEQNLRRRHEEEIQHTHKFASQKFAAEL